VRKLYALLSQCHRHLGENEQALSASRNGRDFYPDDVELLFQEGLARRAVSDAAGAEACWLRLLEPRRHEHFASVDAGLAGYKARHNLALLYREQARLGAAETQWRAALVEQPAFLPAVVGLGEIFLTQGKRCGA
jgi:tetratricopeptide (TPR) repeat protein